jgi:hypothetical protein
VTNSGPQEPQETQSRYQEEKIMEFTTTKCDGPGCEVDKDDRRVQTLSMKISGWFVVYGEGMDSGPWHFHSVDCLENWAVKKNA